MKHLLVIPLIATLCIPPHLLAEVNRIPNGDEFNESKAPQDNSTEPPGGDTGPVLETKEPEIEVDNPFPLFEDNPVHKIDNELPGSVPDTQELEPTDTSHLNSAAKELVVKGYRDAAAGVCLDIAKARGEDVSKYTTYVKKPFQPSTDRRLGLPPLFQRKFCDDNFKRDRCEALYSSSLQQVEQARLGTKLISRGGEVDLDLLERVVTALGKNKAEFVQVMGNKEFKPSELLQASAVNSGSTASVLVTELMLGNSSIDPKTILDEISRGSPETVQVKAVLEQAPILTLTQILVGSIDEALAKGETSRADVLKGLLEELNPSAATGLNCLLGNNSSGGSADIGSPKVGPISGKDYSKLENTESAAFLAPVVAILAEKAVEITVAVVTIGVTVYYANKADDREEARAERERLQAERDAQRFSWELEERSKKQTEAAKVAADKAKAEGGTVTTGPSEATDSTSGSTHVAPKDETFVSPLDLTPLPPGSGGNSGELLDPETLMWRQILNDLRDKAAAEDAAQAASIMHFDQTKVDEFCMVVMDDAKADYVQSLSSPITQVEPELNLGIGTSNVIDFKAWKDSDRPELSIEDLQEDSNCHVMDPVEWRQ